MLKSRGSQNSFHALNSAMVWPDLDQPVLCITTCKKFTHVIYDAELSLLMPNAGHFVVNLCTDRINLICR